jgi:hypothetical protein
MIAAIDKERLELSPRLAVVLSELAEVALAGSGFVPHPALTVRIAERIGRPVTEHNRAQLVSRLLKAFKKKGIDHFLESDRCRGVRLRLRRPQTEP